VYKKPKITNKGKLKQFAGSPLNTTQKLTESITGYNSDLDYDIGDYDNYD